MNNRRSFIVGIKSIKLLPREKIFLKKYKPWGVILFSRNIKTINQTLKLTNSIRGIFNDKKYPILVDQEGGRVNRLKNIISFDYFISEFFGNKFVKDFKEFNLIYKLFIDKTSYLLNLMGININTYPVLDLKVKNSSNIIGDRSFSKSPKIVSKIGEYCIDYFHNNGIGTIIKHIPGHGLAKVDSHFFTPKIKKKINYLMKKDFLPFMNKKSFFAMTAHVIFDDIDNQNTVTHSKILIELIRKKIGFKNILISDDLSMKSLKVKLNEMEIIGKNSPLISKFISKKTSQFYKILS